MFVFPLLHPRFTPQTEVSVVFAGVIKRNPSVVENECIYPRKAGVPVAVSILGWLVSFIAVSVTKLPATDLLMLPMFQGVEPRPGHDGSLWSFHVGMRRAIQAREEKQMEKKWKPNCFAPPSFFGAVRSDQDAQTEILTLIIIFCGTSVSVLLFRGVAMLPAHKDPGWHS